MPDPDIDTYMKVGISMHIIFPIPIHIFSEKIIKAGGHETFVREAEALKGLTSCDPTLNGLFIYLCCTSAG